MAKKRIHEIAKEQGLSSKDVLDKLQAAGLDVKAAASTVEEGDALRALGGGNGSPAKTSEPAAAAGGGKCPPAKPPRPGGAPPRRGARRTRRDQRARRARPARTCPAGPRR